jgi:hypothetical protein
MKAKEKEKILAFDCKYSDGVKKRTHRRLLNKTPVSGLHLQRATIASMKEREKRPLIYAGNFQILHISNFVRQSSSFQVS